MITLAERPPQGDAVEDPPAFLTAVTVFAVLALILPILAVNFGTVLGDSTNMALAYLITLYSATMIARICYAGSGAIIRMAFFVFCYVFMGLSVFAQVAELEFPLHLPGTGAYGRGEIRHSLFSVIVGIAAFEIGSLVVVLLRRRTHQADAVTSPRRTWRLSESRLLILGAIGLCFALLLIERVGLRPFFDSREATGNAVFGSDAGAKVYSVSDKSGKALLRVLGQIPILIALFGILYMKHHKLWQRGSEVRNILTPAILSLLIVANIIVNNPIANSRYWFGTVAITLASIYIPLNRAKGVRWAAILALFALLFAFTSLQAFRRTGGAKDYSSGFRSDLVSSGTYSEFTMELIGRRWLTHNPHTQGEQLLGSALIFVPRSLWANKPVDTGNLVLPYSNPAASLWTEGEVEGGWLVITVYFGALGAAATVLGRRLRYAKPGSLAHAAIPIAGGFTIFVLRGSLLAVFGPAYIIATVLLFCVRRTELPEAEVLEAAPAVPAGSAGSAVPVHPARGEATSARAV